MITELIRKNRSCRKFHQEDAVSMDTLKRLVNLARMSASAGNLQPLKYLLSCGKQKNDVIFSCLAWAAFLKDWAGPEQGERPPAYIIVMGDSNLTSDFGCDHGIASQSILLGAREMGLAGCILGALNRKKLQDALDIAQHFKILLVLAIGKPKEKAIIEALTDKENIKYWRDDENVHHVPKRSLDDIIVNCWE